MARLPRLALAGQVHHLIQRGHNGAAFVRDDVDRREFLARLRESSAQFLVVIHAYALLDDQLHLLATPPDASALSRMMQSLGRGYAAWFNRRHARSGGLWDGRFRAAPLDAEAYLLACMRYIELQPLRQGRAAVPQEFGWSSARHHLGLQRDALVQDHLALWALGNTPFEREASYRRYLEEGSDPAEALLIEQSALKGWPLGPARYLADIAKLTPRATAPRPRGRPPGRSTGTQSEPKTVPI